uniref:Uncharacterized protein n=1 Tax=viral metagenome TaxID=1070528 RepID=A0A6M3LA17_9ZZZZ
MNEQLEKNKTYRITIANLEREVDMLKCCGNCRYYKSHECYCFHNWEPYRKCLGQFKRKWKFASR